MHDTFRLSRRDRDVVSRLWRTPKGSTRALLKRVHSLAPHNAFQFVQVYRAFILAAQTSVCGFYLVAQTSVCGFNCHSQTKVCATIIKTAEPAPPQSTAALVSNSLSKP